MSMLALKKVLAFLKHYWYIPLVAVAAIVLYFVAKKQKLVDWGKILKEAQTAHHDEVQAIERANKDQIDATNAAIRRAQYAEEQIRAEYERNLRDLDAAKEKRIKKIIKQLKDDPKALADELEKETGYKVVIVD